MGKRRLRHGFGGARQRASALTNRRPPRPFLVLRKANPFETVFPVSTEGEPFERTATRGERKPDNFRADAQTSRTAFHRTPHDRVHAALRLLNRGSIGSHWRENANRVS